MSIFKNYICLSQILEHLTDQQVHNVFMHLKYFFPDENMSMEEAAIQIKNAIGDALDDNILKADDEELDLIHDYEDEIVS